MTRAWRHLLPRIWRDDPVSGSPLQRRIRRLSSLERLEEARAFHALCSQSAGASARASRRRWSAIRRDLLRSGTYEHTPEELAFGARVAWRNHARCIGRLFWEGLHVFDARSAVGVDALADRLLAHLDYATNEGRIRSTITIFPPVAADRMPAHVESRQTIQYAGHVVSGGGIRGDRRNIEATRIARSLGWRGPAEAGDFDLLPVILRDEGDRRLILELPVDSVREVAISHPTCPAVDDLGLRWYAVPVVSDMILSIGGVDYPCCPFNGFYMSTEIASRNFADRDRYDRLPEVGRALRLGPGSGTDQFWRDEALTELNRAVTHSYAKAGVTLVDHHTASEQFMEFVRRESAEGRRVSADWSWVVPPQASAACEVYHLPMVNHGAVPNFYHSRSTDGRDLMPFYGDRYLSTASRRLDTAMRAWKRWRRQRN